MGLRSGWRSLALGLVLAACGPAQQVEPARPHAAAAASGAQNAPASPAASQSAAAVASAAASAPTAAVPSEPAASAATPEAAPALPPWPTLTHDTAGVALPEGTLRRFGGSRFQTRHRLKLLFSPAGDLSLAIHQQSVHKGQPPRFTLVDGVTGKTLFQKTGTVKFWWQAALSPDLRWLVDGSRDAVVWDSKSGKQLAKRRGFVSPYAFVADSILGFRKRQLLMWNPKTGAVRPLLTLTGGHSQLQAAGDTVAVLEKRKDKKHKHKSKEILWLLNVKSNKKRSYPLPADISRYNLTLALDQTGRYALLGSNSRILSAELSGSDLRPLLTLPKSKRHASKMLLSATESLSVASDGERLILFRTDTGSIREELVSDATIKDVAMSHDGRVVATLNELGEVRRFRTADGQELVAPIGKSWVSSAVLAGLSHDKVVTAGRRVDFWDVVSGKQLASKRTTSRIIEAHPLNDKAVVTLSFAGEIKRWSLDGLDDAVLARDARKSKLGSDIWRYQWAQARDAASHLVVDTLNGRIAYSKSDKEQRRYGESIVTRVIDTDGKLIFSLPAAAVGPTAMAFGSNGQLAVAQDEVVAIYNQKGHAIARRYGHHEREEREKVVGLAFSVDAKRLAMITSRRLEVWDIEQDELTAGLAGNFTAVAFVDADHVIVGDHEGALTTMSLRSHDSRRHALLPDSVTRLSVSPRGVLALSESGAPVLLAPAWLRPPSAGSPAAGAAPAAREVAVVANAQQINLFSNSRGKLSGCVSAAGTISCWGKNSDGMLGFGDDKARPTAEALGMTPDGFAIDGRRGCGWKDGRVSCWGQVNEHGGAKWSKVGKKPTELTLLAALRARELSLSPVSWCALRHDRTVACHWGRRSRRRDEVVTFKPVAAARGITALDNSDEHGCAIDGDAAVWCWGDNSEGQLGYGQASSQAPAHAVRVLGVRDATHIAVGAQHACARTKSGELWCWGAGRHGQLGDGRGVAHARPVKLPGLRDVRAIALAGHASCAIWGQGSVSCWGKVAGLRKDDQLVMRPQRVTGVSSATAIATTGRQSCVVARGGKILCWGAID